jgi:AcrR family transcriptional regulator
MDDPAIPLKRSRGRPRAEHVDEAILRATSDLLAEQGLANMTVDDVAARAGVGKASIYRRWPTKSALVFDAFLGQFLSRQPLSDTGNFQSDLLTTLRGWIRAVKNTPTGRTLADLIAEVQRDPDLAVMWRERFVGPVRSQFRAIVDRAIARGEIPAATDPEVVLDLLFGPAYHRLLQHHLPLTDRYAQQVAAMVYAGATAGAAQSVSHGSSLADPVKEPHPRNP